METDKNETPAFQLHGGAMQNRLRDVFGCLDDLEVKHKAFEQSRASEDAESDRSLIHQSPNNEDMETINPEFKHPGALTGRDYHSSGRGSRHGHTRIGHNVEFKKPVPPSHSRGGRSSYRGKFGRGRAMPDYTIHPERWTEYSLEDVDVSDASNKKAAFSFLQERQTIQEKDLKSKAVDLDTSACSRGQLVFKRPSKAKTSEAKQDKATDKLSMSNVDMETDNDLESEVGDMNLEEADIKTKTEVEVSDDISGNSAKRKHEDPEDRTDSGQTSNTDKSVGFKSRKISKRQIRSRHNREEDSDSS